MNNLKSPPYNTRALAAQVLFEVLSQGRSLSQSLPTYKSQCKKSEDASFLQALVFGVLRWYPRLSFLANQLLQKPIKPKEIELLYLICIGLFQLSEMKVADHAAIAETVKAARLLNKSWGTGLVNAVLRGYQRQSENLTALIEKCAKNNPSVFYAHPEWLIQKIKTAWPEYWQSILKANNTAPPLTLRVNILKATREEYLELLKKTNMNAESLPATKMGIVLNEAMDVTKLPGFESGLFSVQDESAQFAVELLELKPGHRVLDACAAPGGKTTHLIESEPGLSEVVALEVDAERGKRIYENLNRLQLQEPGLAPIKIIIGDAGNPNTWWDGKAFDRILLDAPCSATGVIRRHPDIKYLRCPEDIQKLQAQQLRLLRSLWPLLKPGGILLYATCSIFPQENVEVLQIFLKELSLKTEEIEDRAAKDMPFTLPDGILQPIGQQLLPGENNRDGFYYAKLKKEFKHPS